MQAVRGSAIAVRRARHDRTSRTGPRRARGKASNSTPKRSSRWRTPISAPRGQNERAKRSNARSHRLHLRECASEHHGRRRARRTGPGTTECGGRERGSGETVAKTAHIASPPARSRTETARSQASWDPTAVGFRHATARTRCLTYGAPAIPRRSIRGLRGRRSARCEDHLLCLLGCDHGQPHGRAPPRGTSGRTVDAPLTGAQASIRISIHSTRSGGGVQRFHARARERQPCGNCAKSAIDGMFSSAACPTSHRGGESGAFIFPQERRWCCATNLQALHERVRAAAGRRPRHARALHARQCAYLVLHETDTP